MSVLQVIYIIYMTERIYLLLNDIRSSLNVGSLLRTADGLGVSEVFLCGYTPYPAVTHDPRLPHLAAKIDRRIKKSALGAETSQAWSYEPDVFKVIDQLKRHGVFILALEQSSTSQPLSRFKTEASVCLVLGSETTGLSQAVLKSCDAVADIAMLGKKESFNVAVAGGMALFYLRNML